MNIKGKRILLRAVERSDLAILNSWFNDPNVSYELGDLHFPTSFHVQEKWFEGIHANERTVRLVVEDENSAMIGMSGFWNIHWRDRRAESSIIIGDKSKHGKGYGRDIIATCSRYAFEEMGLYRLDASILSTNSASLRLYESCGFVIEGRLRGHCFRGGHRVDRLCLGLLADEYFEWTKKTNIGNE